MECDKCCLTVALLRQVFQLTHSRGVRLVIFAFAPCRGKHFNSRTHVECDVNTAGIFIPTNDFNSRTHVECDIIHRFDSLVKQISTHALTWSATKSYFVRRLDSQISTHALTWSATHLFHCYNYTTFHFNSRTHVECDRIQIHMLPVLPEFQLTHSRGVRHGKVLFCGKDVAFQLTHSRGVRRFRDIPQRDFCIFQLTHSRGVRPLITHSRRPDAEISTHALTWSATFLLPILHSWTPISTHALTWSATILRPLISCRKNRFQLTHSRGVRRHWCLPTFRTPGISTHALTWSATDSVQNLPFLMEKFQLTHSRGVRLAG